MNAAALTTCHGDLRSEAAADRAVNETGTACTASAVPRRFGLLLRPWRVPRFAAWGLLLAVPLAGAQPATSSPPPDERFKADALVIAAHPDDETLIAGYLARAVLDEHRRIAVVFTTRGNAGQNLVGYEQGASLAEIRETEARAALATIGIRNVWFLRAPDTPAPEVHDVLRSLGAWNHGNVLGELVRFMRLTRPAVVITMLPDVVVGENHEDHQAAGVVATEAFDLAGDPTGFAEQVATPEDRLFYGNLMEGLRPWQPQKLYFFTDASHLDFVKGKGPEYATTAVSPSQQMVYARLAAREASFHRTQGDAGPPGDHALATGDMSAFEPPVRFVLGKSLVGGAPTGDVFEGTVAGPLAYAAVRGYQPSAKPAIELGGPWAFYADFWPAHNLDQMSQLLAPELGVGGGQNFSVPLLLHNGTDQLQTVTVRVQLPPGWTEVRGSGTYVVAPHESAPVQARLIAPHVARSEWQLVTWTAEAGGQPASTATLKVHVGAP
ncbi:MAG TPA: PIG-L family deacetylase [Opitutaceae bacterium]|nr:PIG-L family deacetylase [Opitutaceae bacterium]